MVDSACRRYCRKEIEQRIIVRESEFWRNSIGDDPAAGASAPLSAGIEDYRIARSVLTRRIRSHRVDAFLESVFGQVCLLKGEAFVDAAAGRRDGDGFLLTSYRIIRCGSPGHAVKEIIPLYELRFHGPEAGSLAAISGDTLRAVIAAEKWVSLDSLSRQILSRTRAAITTEFGISVRRMTGMVPAIRGGDLSLGHISRSWILGVCSGLASTLHTSPKLVRLGFIILTLIFGAGAALYLILWLVMRVRDAPDNIARLRYEDADLIGCPIV